MPSSLPTEKKIMVCFPIAAITSDTDTDGTEIDTAGYQEATIMVTTLMSAAGNTVAYSLQHSSASGTGYSAMSNGPSIPAGNQAAYQSKAQTLRWVCEAQKRRFVKLRVTTGGTTTSTIPCAFIVLTPYAAISGAIVQESVSSVVN